MLKKLLLTFVLILGISNTNAQYYNTYTEVGIMAGPVFFKSDFGEAGNVENFVKNNGFSIGGFLYISQVEDLESFRENFKLRAELSYLKADLEHYGKYVDPSNKGLFARQLRAMSGSTQITSAGFQVEYYPFKIDDYVRGMAFSPYIGFGPQVNYFSSKITSSLGELNFPYTTPVKYMNALRTNDDYAFSLTGTLGVRYKLSEYHSLIAEARGQYYFSDWVDGMNPDKNIYTENKSNDWNIGINLGYIYYFY